jgi:hypothetical protein
MKTRGEQMQSAVHRNRLRVIRFAELGRVRFRGRTWAVGLSPLREAGERGCALSPKRESDRVGAILVSTHLPPDGDMFLEALIHETLHVALPRTKEGDVEAAAHLVTKVLRLVERARR